MAAAGGHSARTGVTVSTTPVRHPRPPRTSTPGSGAVARHRKRSPARQPWWGNPARVAAAAVAAIVVLVGGGEVAGHWVAEAPARAGGGWLANAAGGLAAWAGAWGTQPTMVSAALASRPGDVYRNPLRGVSGLAPGRIDDGADFSGTGPVYALGEGVITHATGTNYGWPGGGWITYRLTKGPAAGLVVYVAEDIMPAVSPGQHVSSSTVLGTMFAGGDGIETGWAQQTGASAEAELPEAGAIGGYGPFPTRVGVNFDELLQTLGVRGAPNRYQSEYGLLPARYPPVWK